MSRFAIISIMLLLFSACGKAVNRVPDVQVAINLPLTDPRLINLSSSGGAVFTFTDPCSGAKYFLEDGSPVKAAAAVSLQEYNVRIAGNKIQVSN